MLKIKKLSLTDGKDVYDMLQELPAEENGFVNNYNGKNYSEFRELLEKSARSSEQVGIVDGWRVPQTTFWLYENCLPVGMGKIRHFLTDGLRNAGGNIGYAVIPSARGKGLGKAFLGMLIGEARKIGVDEILITVHDDNIASLKTALANGCEIVRHENGRVYLEAKN